MIDKLEGTVKRVCVLTDFYSADPTYSLNIIAEEQLGMLVRAGYAPVAVVDTAFKPERIWGHEAVELRHIPPPKERHNDVKFYNGFWDDVATIREALDDVLADVGVVLTHDLIYQSATLPHNFAARDWATSHTDTTWLHWVHSATPSPVWTRRDPKLAPVQCHFPHSMVVFPNAYDVPRVARNFRCNQRDVAVVPHPTDVCTYWGFQDITTRLVYDKHLLDADVIMVYPIRLDRGKQAEYIVHIAAALKEIGRSVRVVVVDFHSTGGDKVVYRDWLKTLAIDVGLNSEELTFTSEFDESLHVRAPRAVVRDLMLLCNVYVHPSTSETYSLTTQEAGLCGAFLILNRDFPPMRSIYGPNAKYCQFSSSINALTGMDGQTTTKYDDPAGYFRGLALEIAFELEYNWVLAQQKRIRQERNPDYVFRHFLEPLFGARRAGLATAAGMLAQPQGTRTVLEA